MNLEKALAELEDCFKECSTKDWDGYGAEPIDEKTYQHARYFLELLPADVPTPGICPEPSGDVGFEWLYMDKSFAANLYSEEEKISKTQAHEDLRMLIVGVDKDKVLSYTGLLDEDITGTAVFDDQIPEKIISLIRNVHNTTD